MPDCNSKGQSTKTLQIHKPNHNKRGNQSSSSDNSYETLVEESSLSEDSEVLFVIPLENSKYN